MTFLKLRQHMSVAGSFCLAAAGVAVGSAPSAAASTATPTAPVVEVCGQGAGLVKPDSMILTCADDGELAVHLRWHTWTARGATASGQVTWLSCASDCARDARWAAAAAQVALTGPVSVPGGGIAFTRLEVRVTGSTPSGFRRDQTFTELPLPDTPASLADSGPAKASATARTQVIPAAASGELSYAKVEGYWILAGGTSGTAETAAAIADAESSLLPGNIQQDVDYCGDGGDRAGWGLWQITCGNSVPKYGTDFQLLDPWNNAEAAVAKYDELGFNAWTTYENGTYKTHLQSVAPDTARTDPGEFVQYGSTPSGTPSSPAPDPGSTYGPPLATSPGEFHVFSVSPTGNLYQDTWSKSWLGWQALGHTSSETLTGTPAIAYDPDDRSFHAYAIGADTGNVYQDTYIPGTGWGTWNNLGGTLQGGLSATYVNGNFHVFGISPTGILYQNTYLPTGWTGWQPIGNAGEPLTGSPAIAYDPDNGTYHAFAIGTNTGNVYQTTYTPTGWGNWQNLGGILQGGLSATYVNGQFHVFSISGTGNLYQNTYLPTGWTGWQPIGNGGEHLTGSPGAVYDPTDNSFHVYAQGATTENMWQVTYTTNTGWANWQNLGGQLLGGFNATYLPPDN